MHSLNDEVKFIERLFGKAIVGKNDISVRCPICKPSNSEKRKLSIKIQQHVTHCWRCGFSCYSLLPLIKKFGNQQQFNEYKEKFLVKRRKDDEHVNVEQRVSLPSDFKLLFDERTLLDPDARACLSYLYSRGLSERDIFLWKFGISNELCWRRRVIIPSFDIEGSLNYFVGRTIDNVFPKYNNVQKDKNNIIFNEIAINWDKPLAIVEGPFDLIKCQFNSTCILGNHLSESSLLFNSILENSTPIVVMLDSDLPEKIHHIALLLSHYNIGVSVTDFGTFKDPGEMSQSETLEKFEAARPWTKDDYVSYKISCVTNARKLL